MKVKHQCAKKVVSDSLGLVDFAIGLVIFVLNLPEGQVMYFTHSVAQKLNSKEVVSNVEFNSVKPNSK